MTPPAAVVLLVAAAVAGPAAGLPQTRDLQALLPAAAAVAPWSPNGPVARYDPATLSNLIDGAAELFLSDGFSRAIRLEYSRGDDSVSCTIYEMASPDAARGIFSHRLSPQAERLTIGDAAARSGFQLTFRQGRQYVVIETFSTGAEADRVLETFARSISANIGREAGI